MGFAAFWTLIGVLLASTRVLLHPTAVDSAEWAHALLGSLRWAYSWAAVAVVAFVLGRRLPLTPRGWYEVLGAHLLIGAALLLARYWVASGTDVWVGVRPQSRTIEGFLQNLLPWDLLYYLLLLGLGHALDYYRRERLRTREISHLRVAAASLETRVTDAQYQALALQIRPAFLFNALRVIARLVPKNSEQALVAIARLADLLRASIRYRHDQPVTLDGEVRLLESYVEIEQIRLGDRLKLHIDVEEAALDAPIPHLLLQQLVEDVVEQSLDGPAGAARIDLRIRRWGESLQLLVLRHGGGSQTHSSETLDPRIRDALQARLHRLYGADPALALLEHGADGPALEIRLPLRPRRSQEGDGPGPGIAAATGGAPPTASTEFGSGTREDAWRSFRREGEDEGERELQEAPPPERRPSWRRPALLGLGFLGFWTLMGVLPAAPRVLLGTGRGSIGWLDVLPTTVVDMYSWGGVALFAVAMAHWLPVSSTGLVRLVGLHLAGGTMVLLLRFFVANGFMVAVGSFSRIRWDYLPLLLPSNILLYSLMAGMGYAIAHHRRCLAQERETIGLRLSATSLETKLAEAQLLSLKAQLHPHFLFNTLNAISSLVRENPSGAVRMVSHLSNLLSAAVSRRYEQEVTIADELQLLQPYLEIEKVRFDDRVVVEIHVDPEVVHARVPDLVLQPLVENAIKHGIAPLSRVGTVRVEARREYDRLLLSVADDGVGFMGGIGGGGGSGVALANLRARLEWLYGRQQTLRISGGEGGGTRVEITIPWRPAATETTPPPQMDVAGVPGIPA